QTATWNGAGQYISRSSQTGMNFHLRAALPLLVLSLVACADQPPPSWHQETGYRWRELRVQGESPGFTRIDSARSGIAFRNDVSDSALMRNRYLGQGAGVSIGDVDGDGRPDVFMARTEGCSALYHNLGDWKFENIA